MINFNLYCCRYYSNCFLPQRIFMWEWELRSPRAIEKARSLPSCENLFLLLRLCNIINNNLTVCNCFHGYCWRGLSSSYHVTSVTFTCMKHLFQEMYTEVQSAPGHFSSAVSPSLEVQKYNFRKNHLLYKTIQKKKFTSLQVATLLPFYTVYLHLITSTVGSTAG